MTSLWNTSMWEGLIQPILTIKVNTREAGSVERIIAEEGSLLQKGDTILTLSNPDLLRSIEDQRDDWEKQRITYQEKEIEMEQKSLSLKQQTLETNYELARLKKVSRWTKKNSAWASRVKHNSKCRKTNTITR